VLEASEPERGRGCTREDQTQGALNRARDDELEGEYCLLGEETQGDYHVLGGPEVAAYEVPIVKPLEAATVRKS